MLRGVITFWKVSLVRTKVPLHQTAREYSYKEFPCPQLMVVSCREQEQCRIVWRVYLFQIIFSCNARLCASWLQSPGRGRGRGARRAGVRGALHRGPHLRPASPHITSRLISWFEHLLHLHVYFLFFFIYSRNISHHILRISLCQFCITIIWPTCLNVPIILLTSSH